MSRLREAVAQGRALIPYLTASDGGDQGFLDAALGAVAGGARVLEVGIPFSDPVADGPVIQQAHDRALRAGGGAERTLELIRKLREKSFVPVVLFTYLNPLLAMGAERFATLAKESGVEGVLSLDAPPEEEPAWFTFLAEKGLDPVVLLSPNTSPERAKGILASGRGFVYVVSRAGVTGTHAGAEGGVEARIATVRKQTTLPLAVGFGVRERKDAEALWSLAEGVIVGSAFVEKMAQAPQELRFDVARNTILELVGEDKR